MGEGTEKDKISLNCCSQMFTAMEIMPLHKLTSYCEAVKVKIERIEDFEWNEKVRPEKWSKKEILGHLVDSALNHYLRLVQSQFQKQPLVFYDQDEWVRAGRYQETNRKELLVFWVQFNRRLEELASLLPEEAWTKTCLGADGKVRSLWTLSKEYTIHLEHHVSQILGV